MRDINLNRRSVLKAAGGAAAAGVTGAVGLSALAGPAASASVSISDTSVETDDGDVSYIDVDVADYWAIWDGFDRPVAAVAFEDVLAYPSNGDTHTLYDQLTDGNGPIQLVNFSTQGSGGDGWGGPDEYASTFDTKTSPDTSVYNQPGANGNPAEATSGYVHAGVGWRVATDDMSQYGARSIETPAVIGTDIPELDNPDDGTTESHTLELRKRVHFYTTVDNGNTGVTADDGTTTVYPMGAEEGVKAMVEATPQFVVDVVNQASSSDTDGSGTSTSG